MKRPGAVLAALILETVLISVPESRADSFSHQTGEAHQIFQTQVQPLLQARCFPCHGGEMKINSGLNLTTREGLLKGGNRGPAVRLDIPQESLLLQAVRHKGPQMPPQGKLSQEQIDLLTRWLTLGFPYTGSSTTTATRPPGLAVDDLARQFWAFKPVRRPDVPKVTDASWLRNPLDAFVLARLEQAGLGPAPPASKTALLRRVHYAVTGLPPTPDEVEAFVADPAPDAYEKVVDRLIASRHYGEHWARHWMDLVRYGETNSFERDAVKPFIWRYRDYVVSAFNEDKPYDRFVREQLAGDELDAVTPEAITATGYYLLGPWKDEPPDVTQAYYDELDDVIATTTQTFLGLTLHCSRCHDHKTDPFPQTDYYRFLAFFHGIRRYSGGSDSLRFIGTEQEDRQLKTWIAERMRRLEQSDLALVPLETVAYAIAGLLAATALLPMRWRYKLGVVFLVSILVGIFILAWGWGNWASFTPSYSDQSQTPLPDPPQALCVMETGPVPPDTHVFLRGDPQHKGDRVDLGFPAVLSSPHSPGPKLLSPPQDSSTSGRRRVLADWIASSENPLTARVLVNRVFQYHFGRGIVRSSSNFGFLAAPPTHPELLDWLASTFVDGGWKLKPLHRLILTSNTFRMASRADAAVLARDPENDLLGRFDLRRLTAEELRDSILASAVTST